MAWTFSMLRFPGSVSSKPPHSPDLACIPDRQAQPFAAGIGSRDLVAGTKNQKYRGSQLKAPIPAFVSRWSPCNSRRSVIS